MRLAPAALLVLSCACAKTASPDNANDIDVSSDLTIAAGTTTTWKAGTTVRVASGVSVTVKGTLAVEGTASSPVRVQSTANAHAGEWGGLVVASGGALNATYLEVHNASRALETQGGAAYTIDHLLVDTSLSVAALASDGTIDHAQLHSQGASQVALPIEVDNASPAISNSLIDEASELIDQVTVDGAASSPVFDHLEVTNSHCAFHFNGGAHVTISHSYVHDNVYGLMVEAATGTAIDDSNFVRNDVQVGQCYGGDVTLTGDYLDSAPFDTTCATQTQTTPATAPLTDVGPQQ